IQKAARRQGNCVRLAQFPMAMLARRVLLSTLIVGSCLGAPGVSACAQMAADPRVEPAETAEVKQPVSSPTNVSAPTSPVQRGAIKISSGDLVIVSVDGVSDYKPEARVSEEGIISLPLIGEVAVGGRTVEQAQDEIARRMSDGNYFRDPRVSVFVK